MKKHICAHALPRALSCGVMLVLVFVLASCGNGRPKSDAPRNLENACTIIKQNRGWHKDMKKVQRKWKVPVSVQMAMIYQESKFNSRARPPKNKSGKRPTSAYGYSQAVDSTWKWYQKDQRRWRAKRNNFGDSADFIGWYVNKSNKINGIRKRDAYNQYLAYHEGHKGFSKKTYKRKKWLIPVARSVQERSIIYRQQLKRC